MHYDGLSLAARTMLPPDTDADGLIRQGWHLRVVDARCLAAHAQHMRSAAGGDDRLRGWAELFGAWGELANGDRPASEAALARANACLARTDDAEGQLMCRSIQSDLWARDGRDADVELFCREALALPAASLSPAVRHNVHAKLVTAVERLGRYDEALRLHYEAIDLARKQGEPAQLAVSLGHAGGLQASLLNLVDALPLCEEAWSLCSSEDWPSVSHLVGANLMSALTWLGRHAEATAMADDLIAREPRFPARHRERRLCLYGMVLARAAVYGRAQACLDQAQAAQATDQAAPVEWIWTQAMVWNRTGRAAQALVLLQPYLDSPTRAVRLDDFPTDRASLYAEAALACEALDDLAAALHCERIAAEARAQAARQAADTRRLTLQIVYQLDAAHRQRDEALKERQRATTEQARLADLNAALQAANEAKTRFLAAASHDLRQPVQALTMYMAALQRERSAPLRGSLMARMDQSLRALGGMFDVLLDLSRLDAGLVRPAPAPLSLDGLLARLVDEHALRARELGLDLRLHRPRGLDAATTSSDAVLLEACLRNLIDNALKYTPRGGVVLRLRPGAGPQPTWRVEVRDTGPGIAPELQVQVFEEFFQVGNEERDRSKGLGLGLSIVQRTALLLGHRLSLRSRPGLGCCFTFELPRVPSDAVACAAPVPDEATAGVRLELAVIDDDAMVRDSLTALLTRWGHRVHHGADVDAVLMQWQAQGRPALDAAIVDLRLRAGRTGLQAIAELREAVGASVPALVMTGDTAPDRLRLLVEAGQAWLPKPLMPLRLRSWLQALGLSRRARP